MSEHRYKFLRLDDDGAIKSDLGECQWTINEWQSVDEVVMCESGFHCSRQVYQAFSFVQGEILAEVEVDGESIINDDKEAWQRMRIIRAWKWQKQDSVALSIFVAELVLDNYETCYPDDKRPREAIEAAKAWLNASGEERESARSAAWSAAESAGSAAGSAARSARSAAGSAAGSAAESAGSAWSAAGSAARSAAWSAGSAWSAAGSAARSAAWSAGSAAGSAGSAAWSALVETIARWMDERLAVLEEVVSENTAVQP